MLRLSCIVNSVFASRTYILSIKHNPEFWLVDCGDVSPLVNLISTMWGSSFSVKGVLLTHAHYDHIYGLPRLTDLFPELKVYTNDYGKVALANERVNMSRYHEDPINFASDNVIVCSDGAEIELFDGVKALVLCTPGHNPSCLTFEIEDNLFTGDAYIPGVPVVTNLPGGDKKLAVQSVERIISLAKDKKSFCRT